MHESFLPVHVPPEPPISELPQQPHASSPAEIDFRSPYGLLLPAFFSGFKILPKQFLSRLLLQHPPRDRKGHPLFFTGSVSRHRPTIFRPLQPQPQDGFRLTWSEVNARCSFSLDPPFLSRWQIGETDTERERERDRLRIRSERSQADETKRAETGNVGTDGKKLSRSSPLLSSPLHAN